MPPKTESPTPPSPWLLLLEARAPWELAALGASLPLLKRAAAGDTHPVMVFPGLGASDLSTLPLRNLLNALGHRAEPWAQGLNLGPRAGVLEQAEEDLERLYRHYQRRISLVGWSLGGLYAREIAKRHPQWVRSVVTLGTPFTGHPRATHAWKFFEWVSGIDSHDEERLETLREPPPVPCTSIYSKSDGIVAWACSVNEPGPQVENIEVPASHIGLGVNPLVLYAVCDRLAQPAGTWRPFAPPPWLAPLYR